MCELGEGSGKEELLPSLSDHIEDWLRDVFGDVDEAEKDGATKETEQAKKPGKHEEAVRNTTQFVEEKVNQVKEQVKQGEHYKNVDEDDSTSVGSFNSEEEKMEISSCDEDEVQFPEFNEVTDMKDPKFLLGMLFTSGTVFREAVRRYAIFNQRPIKLRKNLREKIKWVCSDGCSWMFKMVGGVGGFILFWIV